MQNHIPNIRALHHAIEASLFYRDPVPCWGYNRLTEAITLLSRIVHDYPGESDAIWSIGEFGSCTVDSLIVGAYWHYSEWHAGQNSESYRALSCLGQVYRPGMASGPEPDSTENDVYRALDSLARKTYGMPVYRFARLYA